MDRLRVAKEDVLRYVVESGRPSEWVGEGELSEEVGIEGADLDEILGELESEGKILRRGNRIRLTEPGLAEGASLYERHRTIEEFFRREFREGRAHDLAHVLEHVVPGDLLGKMRERVRLAEGAVGLGEVRVGSSVKIVAISAQDSRILSRLLGMGLAPGAVVSVTEDLGDGIVVEVSGRKVALGRELADMILVIPEGGGGG